VRHALRLVAIALFLALRVRAAWGETSVPLASAEQGSVVVAEAYAARSDAAGPTQAAAGNAAAPASDSDALELELDNRPTSFPDPLESLNRQTFSFNQVLDRWLLSPVAEAYGSIVPDRAKRSVRDFFANLESPAIFVNDVLQGELDEAATTVARFSVNTTVGLGGLFDPATAMGLEKHNADLWDWRSTTRTSDRRSRARGWAADPS
jgi:hypothetical protein